jgi:glycosyltransferase involved in cell wall biosynthesis
MKILLSAYACEPGRGTELGVGWNTVREVAKYHEVWVLTRPDDGRTAIEAELARHPVPNLHFVYFTLPIWGSGWKWGNGAFQIHYYLWQIQAYFVARQLHRHICFDLIQHVTFVKYSSPSFISLLPVPFIWGPVGGGESAPKAFWQDFSWKGKIYETLRNISRRVGELDPFARLTAQRSVLAWATTEDTAQQLSQMGAKNVQVLSQVALLPEEIARLSQNSIASSSTVRFISIGRLLHWKGFHLGLRAFAQANLPSNTEYSIVGDGPERKQLQRLAQELGISSRVKFYSEMPRDSIWQMLGEARALIHPSLHESGGFVCLEAMAAGRPVICLDLGGPAVQVTEATGFKIPAIAPQQAVADIADAMTRLANDAKLSAELGKAGQRRANELFNWANKGQQLVQHYDKILNQQTIPHAYSHSS